MLFKLLVEPVKLCKLGSIYACACARLVEQVDSLVGQEPVVDVSFRKHRTFSEHSIGDVYTVEPFVVALDALEHLDCLVHCRLTYADRLETPFKRSVLFDILSVLLESGRTNDLYLAS